MTSSTKITLNNGQTDHWDADFDPVVTGGDWHPSEYVMADAENMAATLIGGQDEDGNALKTAAELGIKAVTDFKPSEKWSCSFSGKLIQNGIEIGTFEASTSYRFD